VKFLVLAAFAALSLVSLSACGGANTITGLAGVPAANVIVPLTRTVEVTALNGGSPIRGLEISLTRNSWPGGKLIAKGKTGPRGRVRLSGNWTNQEFICVGGRLQIPSGYKERHKCELPFPQTITLRF
jgi:5-hydroxyisourate hydrolase-like protein (transthyretin family)